MAEIKSAGTLFNPCYSPIATVYASGSWITRFSLTKMLCSIIGSIIFMSSRVLSSHYRCPHRFSATSDDKVNDCGFKFSVVCEWCVLFKEDKDDSLQFAKVFPAKFLKLPIRQSFPPPPFCAIQYIHTYTSLYYIHIC